MIRLLKASEIEARVQTVTDAGCSVLLYKDARCDMKILDETFGVFGWQRKHGLVNNNLFCTISIWDNEKECWVEKQDVGTESNTEKEKGQASDSFKRAGVNIGIGRELYTSPFIWITLNDNEFKTVNGKKKLKTTFHVSKVSYNEEREIDGLVVKDNNNKVRYTLSKAKPSCNEISEQQVKELFDKAKNAGVSSEAIKKVIMTDYNKTTVESLTKAEYDIVCDRLEAKAGGSNG